MSFSISDHLLNGERRDRRPSTNSPHRATTPAPAAHGAQDELLAEEAELRERFADVEREWQAILSCVASLRETLTPETIDEALEAAGLPALEDLFVSCIEAATLPAPRESVAPRTNATPLAPAVSGTEPTSESADTVDDRSEEAQDPLPDENDAFGLPPVAEAVTGIVDSVRIAEELEYLDIDEGEGPGEPESPAEAAVGDDRSARPDGAAQRATGSSPPSARCAPQEPAAAGDETVRSSSVSAPRAGAEAAVTKADTETVAAPGLDPQPADSSTAEEALELPGDDTNEDEGGPVVATARAEADPNDTEAELEELEAQRHLEAFRALEADTPHAVTEELDAAGDEDSRERPLSTPLDADGSADRGATESDAQDDDSSRTAETAVSDRGPPADGEAKPAQPLDAVTPAVAGQALAAALGVESPAAALEAVEAHRREVEERAERSGDDVHSQLGELVSLLRRSLDKGQDSALSRLTIPREVTLELAREIAGRVKDSIVADGLVMAGGSGAREGGGASASPAAREEEALIPLDDVAALIDRLTKGP